MSINPYLFFLLINFFVLLSAQLIHLLLLYIVQLNLFFNEEDTVFEIRLLICMPMSIIKMPK